RRRRPGCPRARPAAGRATAASPPSSSRRPPGPVPPPPPEPPASLSRSSRLPLLAQPAFAPLVVLDVPIRLPGAHVGKPEIELLDVGVLPERPGVAVEDDP